MRAKLSSYTTTLSLILLGLFLLTLPLIFTTLTTDNFALPKQLSTAKMALFGLLLFGIKSIADKTVRFRKTPLNLPVFLFALAAIVSSALAVNKAESLVASATLLFPILVYYLITNFAKTKKAVFFLVGAFFEGAVLLSVLYVLTFFKIYILPFNITHSQVFTPIGTLLDQAIYLAAALGFAIYFINLFRATKFTKTQKSEPKFLAIVGLAALKIAVILVALGLTIYALVKIQNPLILPLVTGFQVGFASISQDINRAILSFLFGSGLGTFATDFARFKLQAFNQTPLWNLTFFKSSSFVLELLATTGVVGTLSFFYLIFKILRERPWFPPLLILIVLSLVLPFSTTILALFFAVLGLFGALRSFQSKNYYDVELGLVTLKSGLVTVSANEKKEVRHGLSSVFTFSVFLIILLLTGLMGFLTFRYGLANLTFQKSLAAASQNKGSEVYKLQSEAVSTVPYSDVYQRLFSQTNLSLANSLSEESRKEASPSAQTQQTIYTLIQQAINSGRTATTLSPQTAINWQNLSAIYRSLIGFGRDADKFAIQAAQQAIFLDPNNPQQFINLGGLYYQLRDWEKAEEQFRLAVNLKPDFANAYYNLAHTLQEKGDLQAALTELEKVRELVKNDPQNLKKVEAEIELLKAGLGTDKQPAGAPSATLPAQNPPVAIPAPATPTPTPVASPTPTPTSAPLQ